MDGTAPPPSFPRLLFSVVGQDFGRKHHLCVCACREQRGIEAPLRGQQLFQLMAEFHTSVNFSVITQVGDYGSFLGRNNTKTHLCVFNKYTCNEKLGPRVCIWVALVNGHSLRPR